MRLPWFRGVRPPGALNGGRNFYNPDIPSICDPSWAQISNHFASTHYSPTGRFFWTQASALYNSNCDNPHTKYDISPDEDKSDNESDTENDSDDD